MSRPLKNDERKAVAAWNALPRDAEPAGVAGGGAVMTEGHAGRVRESIGKAHDEFWAALETCDREGARKAWLRLAQIADQAVRDSQGSRIEADALATELEVYRPTRSQQPPAPDLDDYEYVFTAAFPWVCAAKIRKDVVFVNAGAGYWQDCWLPEKTTLCGKKTAFPANERFDSGGWPRMRELCPDCIRKLDALGLLGEPLGAPAIAEREPRKGTEQGSPW